MKRSTAWKCGGASIGSTCCGSTGAGRIGLGEIGGRSSQRTYALSRIRPQCVRGLLSHHDSDPLQQRPISVSVAPARAGVSRWGGSCTPSGCRNPPENFGNIGDYEEKNAVFVGHVLPGYGKIPALLPTIPEA